MQEDILNCLNLAELTNVMQEKLKQLDRKTFLMNLDQRIDEAFINQLKAKCEEEINQKFGQAFY